MPDNVQSSGAIYRICMPNNWNGDLIIYAHGYVSPTEPIGIPEEQITLNGNSIIDVTNLLGYAFATTSYSTNGLAVQEGIADIVDLADIFESKFGQPTHTYLVGVSEGGLIAALSAEHYPDNFDGILAMCGPYGDFGEQINYLGDFRVLFDYFFPGLMPGEATNIPQTLQDNWDAHFQNIVKPVITNPASAYTVTQLLTTAQTPLTIAPSITNTATIEKLLWYNVFATNDGAIKLGGQPFSNTHRLYTGSADDVALNAGVARFSSDALAVQNIHNHYVTSGAINKPVVTLHTIDDPLVPYWQATLYKAKIVPQYLYAHIAVNRYGHCAFTAEEVLTAFGRLLTMTQGQQLYLPVMRHN